MNIIKKLAKETVIYGFGSVVGRILNYLLVPFYTRIFLPTEYGVITEFYAYVAFLDILYTYGMETAYFRFATQKAGQERESFNTATTALLISSLLFSLLLIFLAQPIVMAMAYPSCERYVYYFAVILAIDAIVAIPFAQLRLQKKVAFFTKAKLLHIGLNIVGNLFFLYFSAQIYAGSLLPFFKPFVLHFYHPAWQLDYVFIANLVASTALLWILNKPLCKLQFTLPWQRLKMMLAYGLPLLLMGFAGMINEMLSRAILKYILPIGFYPNKTNEAVLGIFGACYKLAIFMALVVQAFRYAAEPFFFSKANAKNSPALFSQVMHGFIVVACVIVFAVSVNLDFLGVLLLSNPVYREGIDIVPYLLLAYLFLGIYYNCSVWFKLTNKTHYGMYINSIGACITIVLNVVLIPLLGYWGSVWATVGSYASMSGLCYFFGQKYYPIPYRIKNGLTYILGTMWLVYGIRLIHFASFPITVVANLLLTGVFAFLVYRLERKKFYSS